MKRWIFLLLLILSVSYLNAQTLAQAKTWFLNGRYEKALPVFKQQLQTKPSDGSLNYWYGVCLLQTNNHRAAVPYLEKADAKKVQQAKWQLAIAYLALAAQDSALLYLEQYLSMTNLPAANRRAAVQLKESTQVAVNQWSRVEDILFIDSVVVSKANMYRVLNLSKTSGSLMPAPSLFPRMTPDYGQVFLPERNDRAYYADSLPEKGLELVARHRLLNSWGDPEPLPDNINRETNEFNPFFLQDGVTLYFASDHPTGMGGADLYVTRLNPTSNTYLQPDQLNPPFNSPANDYFLILDEVAGRGYLGTDRRCATGFATIYTFIPNKEKVMVTGKSLQALKSLAEIRSIKNTWVGKNVDSLLQVDTTTPLSSTIRRSTQETLFFINDTVTYHSLDDFKSAAARQQMEQFLAKSQILQEKNETLDGKRLYYSTQNPVQQEALKSEILSLEQEIRLLQQELPTLELSARNLEIKEGLK